MRAALYARVSTRDKDQDPELQLFKLREYARAHDWEISGEFVDHCSGSMLSRPALDQMLEAARKRQIDMILCLRIDRFARSLTNLLNTWEQLEAWGVGFACSEQPIDTKSAHGLLLFQILGAFAQWERTMIRERVKEGMQKARREGKTIGRPRIAFTEEQMRSIEQAALGEISARELQQRLSCSRSATYRILEERRAVPKP